MKALALTLLIAMPAMAQTEAQTKRWSDAVCPSISEMAVEVAKASKSGVSWEAVKRSVQDGDITESVMYVVLNKVKLEVMQETFFKYSTLDGNTVRSLAYITCEQGFRNSRKKLML